MVTNGNEMFRLWGTDNAEAEAIAYNYSNGYVNYSFYAFDDVDDDGDLERVPNGVEVKYELRVESKNDYIGTWEFTSKTAAGREGAGLIDGEFKLANHDEVVDIYVRNVSVVDEVDEEVTLTLDLSNVRLNIGGKAYMDGATLDVEVGSIVEATVMPMAGTDGMVLTDCNLTGANNEVTYSGNAGAEELTIIAMADGVLTVSYEMDTFSIKADNVTVTDYKAVNFDKKVVGGEDVSFELETTATGTSAVQDVPTVTIKVQAVDDSTKTETIEATVSNFVAGEDAKDKYTKDTTVDYTNYEDKVAGDGLYYLDENGEYQQAVAGEYDQTLTYYTKTEDGIDATASTMTVTFAMPLYNATVTDITVA